MTNIARFAIEQPLYTWLLILTCLIGGIVGIDKVGRLEDPNFPIKTVLIVTRYDGASAVEVEQEVTDVIEAAIQELPYVDELTSKSLDGRSEVMVQLLEQYDDDDTPQIFDELRRRVTEAAGRLPPGAGVPLVEDDFGDIYGVMYAVSVEGFTPAEIRDVSRYLSTNLKSVPSVAKVQTAGEPFEAIYVEIDHTRLTRLGLPIESVFSSIAIQNQVTPAGSVAFDGRRLRIAPQMAFDSVQAVGDMRIGRAGSTEIIRLSDVATITREPVEVPFQLVRHEGQPSFTVGVSIVAERNVVEVGRDIEAKMRELSASLPLGMEVSEIYAQHKVVNLAIQEFLKNLALSVLTVVVALCIFMGWRAGMVVGMVLLLTVLGTLGIMAMIGVELQRISLGALMIAMGMLVDNGIVVAEGMIIGVRRGLLPVKAAESAVKRTQFPLLGATVIGIVAFGPISLSDDNSGHFLVSLFQVVAISLLLSWVLAVTVVPLFGKYLLRPGEAVDESVLYSGWGYAPYRLLLGASVRYAWLSALAIFGILVACLWSFQFVKQGFFPTTNSPLFYVDYRLPEGSDIRQTEKDVIEAEQEVTQLAGVESVTSFIGRGATRFTTIMNPEQPNSAYAQLVIRVQDVALMDGLMVSVGEMLGRIRPEAEVQVTRAEFTPSGTSKIEARFSGPDAEVLRDLAGQALDIYLKHNLRDRKTDWRQPQLQLVPYFDATRAQVAGITRRDLSQALAFATLGVNVGLFRDDDKVIPIIARAPAGERMDLEGMLARMVWSPTEQAHIPMSQVVDEIKLESVDSTIYRRHRARTIQAQANPPIGHNPTRTFNRIRAEVEAIPLPLGYAMEWGGEHEASDEANTTLTQKIPFAFLLMFFITILMFGKLKQPIVIWLTVPLTVCGVVIGLLATNLSFTFPSFLGFLSLSGMLVKNCIVLVDEIDKRFAETGMRFDVLVQAAVSRLRPVMLAAGTTIAGMSPLLGDPFFREMAVCIMSGLAFATLITLIAVPVFYRIALGKRVAQS
jgi:multidrug efflux pump subunit AcrB